MKKTTTTIRVHGIDLPMDHKAIATRMLKELHKLCMFRARGWKKERRFLVKMGPAWRDDDWDRGRTYVCLCGDRFPVLTTTRSRRQRDARKHRRFSWMRYPESIQIPNPPDLKELARAIRHARKHLRKKTALHELFDQHQAMRILTNPKGRGR